MVESRIARAASGARLALLFTQPAQAAGFAFQTHYVDLQYGGSRAGSESSGAGDSPRNPDAASNRRQPPTSRR